MKLNKYTVPVYCGGGVEKSSSRGRYDGAGDVSKERLGDEDHHHGGRDGHKLKIDLIG